jgi:hypothetical protein
MKRALGAKTNGGGKNRKNIFSPRGSVQPIEKAQSGQGNPRDSKLFPLISFDFFWLGMAGFGKIWVWLGNSTLILV